jgi:hypothetical protein
MHEIGIFGLLEKERKTNVNIKYKLSSDLIVIDFCWGSIPKKIVKGLAEYFLS